MVVSVIINSEAKALNKTFDYIVPYELEKRIKIGNRVSIPFGNSKMAKEGYVIEIKEKSDFAKKYINNIEKDGLEESRVHLASLISRMYFCNFYDAIKLMLPPGTTSKDTTKRIKEKTLNFVSLNKPINEIEKDIKDKNIKSEKHIKILNILKQNGEMLVSEVIEITGVSRVVIKTLEKNNYVSVKSKEVYRDILVNKKEKRDTNLVLTEEQKIAFDKVNKKIKENEFGEFLLFGITGSRKNRSIFAAYRRSNKE